MAELENAPPAAGSSAPDRPATRLVTDDGVLVGAAGPLLDDLGLFRLADALRR